MNIVITAGGTSENIDAVRKITNTSTGRLGSIIFGQIVKLRPKNEKIKIFYIAPRNAVEPPLDDIEIESDDVFLERYTTTDTLSVLEAITNVLKTNKIDYFIHSMAISDYRVEKVMNSNLDKLDNSKKLSSDEESLLVRLVKTPKIINKIKEFSPSTTLFGFKLLNNVQESDLIEAAKKQFANAGSDYILANDSANITANQHKAMLIRKTDLEKLYLNTKEEIANAIASVIYSKIF